MPFKTASIVGMVNHVAKGHKRPSASDVFGKKKIEEEGMTGVTYCFALHKWRHHALLKDKMPDERRNSFHPSSSVAELLSDL